MLSAPPVVKPIIPDAPPPLPSQEGTIVRRFRLFGKKLPLDLNQQLLIGLYALTLIGFWTFLDWPSDLFSHFRAQYIALFAVGLSITLIRKQPMWAILAFTGLCLNLSEIWPAHFVQPSSTDAPSLNAVQARLKVMQMNVLFSNRNYQQASDAILEMNPDILSLQEVDSNWLEALSPVLRRYPYHIAVPSDATTTGIALYSKYPLLSTKTQHYAVTGAPAILSGALVNGEWVTLLAVHPVPPVFLDWYKERNAIMAGIADKRHTLGENLIVVGDLNNTPYSSSFKQFITETGLRNTREGRGLLPSWPALLTPLGLPIDHVLVSSRFRVLDYRIGPLIGSDHYPILVELGLGEPEKSADNRQRPVRGWQTLAVRPL